MYRRAFEPEDTVATLKDKTASPKRKFSTWAIRNINDAWGLEYIDDSSYRIWFSTKKDAERFVEKWYA